MNWLNLLKIWPLLGSILALAGCILGSPLPVAAAEIANPYCNLFVRTGMAPAQKAELAQRGYRVVESANLQFSLLSLRAHSEKGAWILQRAAKYDRVYFEFADQLGNFPILNFTLEARGIASCANMQKSIASLSERRRLALRAIRYLRGDRTVSMTEAILDLENLEIGKRGLKLSLNKPFLDLIRKKARESWSVGANAQFFKQLNNVRQSLVASSLGRYCRDQTTLTELSINNCTNCVGQTALILSQYLDLQITPPAPWQFGFMLYNDHMAPVLYDAGRDVFVDLMYNKVKKNSQRNPVLAPSELLRMALRKHREVILPFDKITLESIDYLSSTSVMDFFTADQSAVPDASALGAGRVEAFSFTGIRTRSSFATGPVPATADLSGVLNDDYTVPEDEGELALNGSELVARRANKSRVTNKSAPTAKPSDLGITEESLVDLLPSERSIFLNMIRRDLISPAEWQKFSMAQLSAGATEEASEILRPFTLTLNTALAGKAPFRLQNNRPQSQSPELQLPSESLVREFKALSLVERYRRLITLGQEFSATLLARDIEALNTLFTSDQFLDQASKNPENWLEVFVRLEGLTQNWGLNHVFFFKKDVGLNALIPRLIRLESVVQTLSRYWGQHHRQFLQMASELTPERMTNLNLFFARLAGVGIHSLLGGDYTERRFTWKGVTRPLMLAILYDKKILWTGPRTSEERQQQQVLEAERIPVEDKIPPEIQGPKLDLPKMGRCEGDQGGWVQDGSFAWRCPETAKQRVIVNLGSQSIAVAAREVREISAPLLAGLFVLNYQMFFHPGHFLMMHQMWAESIRNAMHENLMRFAVHDSAGDKLLNFAEVITVLTSEWKLAPMLLSEKLPIFKSAQSPDPRQFLAYTAKRRENPDWLLVHDNYLEAYKSYKKFPRKEIKKRNLLFGSSGTADGVASAVQKYVPYAAQFSGTSSTLVSLSYGNATYRLFEYNVDDPNARGLTLNVRARIGDLELKAELEDDTSSLRAAPESIGGFNSYDGCLTPLSIELADGQIFVDARAGFCTSLKDGQ